jgi:hypothetical protein
VGPAKELGFIIVDVLVAEKHTPQLFRLESTARRLDDIMRVAVETLIDPIDSRVFCLIASAALLRRQAWRDHLRATIKLAAIMWAPSFKPRLMNGSITVTAGWLRSRGACSRFCGAPMLLDLDFFAA